MFSLFVDCKLIFFVIRPKALVPKENALSCGTENKSSLKDILMNIDKQEESIYLCFLKHGKIMILVPPRLLQMKQMLFKRNNCEYNVVCHEHNLCLMIDAGLFESMRDGCAIDDLQTYLSLFESEGKNSETELSKRMLCDCWIVKHTEKRFDC